MKAGISVDLNSSFSQIVDTRCILNLSQQTLVDWKINLCQVYRISPSMVINYLP